MTSVADWLPEFPPLEITSGMKSTSQGHGLKIALVVFEGKRSQQCREKQNAEPQAALPR